MDLRNDVAGSMVGLGRHLNCIAAAICIAALVSAQTGAAQQPCDRKDFEAVVSEAASALRDLNQKNKPAFQVRLRELKEKRGWGHEQFMKDGAVYVQDTKIAEYDERSTAALESIQRIGAEGASSQSPSCAALQDVRGLMQTLVSIQKDKWSYMFGKIEQALTQ